MSHQEVYCPGEGCACSGRRPDGRHRPARSVSDTGCSDGPEGRADENEKDLTLHIRNRWRCRPSRRKLAHGTGWRGPDDSAALVWTAAAGGACSAPEAEAPSLPARTTLEGSWRMNHSESDDPQQKIRAAEAADTAAHNPTGARKLSRRGDPGGYPGGYPIPADIPRAAILTRIRAAIPIPTRFPEAAAKILPAMPKCSRCFIPRS